MTRDNGSDRDGGDALAAPCGASQSGAEGNRPTLSIPYITTKPLPPSNPDVWPEDEWQRICRIWRGEEE